MRFTRGRSGAQSALGRTTIEPHKNRPAEVLLQLRVKPPLSTQAASDVRISQKRDSRGVHPSTETMTRQGEIFEQTRHAQVEHGMIEPGGLTSEGAGQPSLSGAGLPGDMRFSCAFSQAPWASCRLALNWGLPHFVWFICC